MKLAHNEIKVWCKDIVLISFTVHVVFKEVLFYENIYMEIPIVRI